MEIHEIITALACGHTIRSLDLGEHDGCEYRLVPDAPVELVNGLQIEQMIRDGWLESFNGGYRLTDAGRLEWMRSTDEMGDGELRPPSREPT